MGKTLSQNEIPDWDQLRAQLDNFVIQSQHQQVQKILNDVNPRHIPRPLISIFADLAWRANMPIFAMKALHPIVHPENAFTASASAHEKGIYSLALISLGAVNEGIALLETINPATNPEVLLQKSLAYFKLWNYRASIPLLNEYIHRAEVLPYKRLVGKVNLAAALIFTNALGQAAQCLEDVQEECQKNSYLLLLGNCFELKAQIEFFQGHYDVALNHLEIAKSHLKNQAGEYLLYVEKWRLAIESLKKPTLDNLNELRLLKGQAENLRHWETVRECDLFEAIANQDQELIKKIIMGTPVEHYRNRVRLLWGKNIKPQGHYSLKLIGSLLSGDFFKFDPYKSGLHEQVQLLHLFQALTLDFYKPSHIGLLFERIYPDESFNPFSSPARVLQLLRRLNKWLLNHQVPIRIEMKKSEFRLVAFNHQNVDVMIYRGQKLSKETGLLRELKEHFKGRTFSTQQVAEKMNLSRASAQKFLNHALTAGDLVKVGSGRSSQYRLFSNRGKRSAA